jgi:hypothetical protein
METINQNWRPHKKSSNALLANGYSQKQLNDTGKLFIERYFNQQLHDASTRFTNMVRSSGSGHNVKAPKSGYSEVMKKREIAERDRSKRSEERAQEVIQDEGVMTQAEAIAWYNARR